MGKNPLWPLFRLEIEVCSGDALQKKYTHAIMDLTKYGRIFYEFTEWLKPENVAMWTTMVVTYESDQI